MNSMNGRSKIFVYGTLRQDGRLNGFYMQGQPLVGQARLSGYVMKRISSYPGIEASGNSADVVLGEVYDVTAKCLAGLDSLEGHPNMYRREIVCVTLDGDDPRQEMVYVYVYQRP